MENDKYPDLSGFAHIIEKYAFSNKYRTYKYIYQAGENK